MHNSQIAALSSPFLGSISTDRGGLRESVKSKRKPWSLRQLVMGPHTEKRLLLPWTLVCLFVYLKYYPSDSHWGKEAIQEALTRLRPLRLHTETSPCLPKFNPDPERKFSPPAPPHAWQAATSGRCQGNTSATCSTWWIFTLAKIWVQKWPDVLALLRFFLKRNSEPDFCN